MEESKIILEDFYIGCNRHIYEALIESDDDFIGMLAYIIYIKQKIEYISEYQKENGILPKEDDLKKFDQSKILPSNIDLYNTLAFIESEKFFNAYFDTEITQLNNTEIQNRKKEEELNKREEKLINKEKKFKENVWAKRIHDIIINIIASFIFSFIVVVLTLMITSNETITQFIIKLLTKH